MIQNLAYILRTLLLFRDLKIKNMSSVLKLEAHFSLTFSLNVMFNKGDSDEIMNMCQSILGDLIKARYAFLILLDGRTLRTENWLKISKL